MGGAKRGEIQNGLAEKNIPIPEKIREDLLREFFFGLANYDRFLSASPKLVQCTSCNTTSLCRAVLAARPLGLRAVLGNRDRRSGDQQNIVNMSANSIEFGSGVGHQGKDAATVFKM
jgi:glyceraldehyde-3-phosphate dehydrogenase (NAD(P))